MSEALAQTKRFIEIPPVSIEKIEKGDQVLDQGGNPVGPLIHLPNLIGQAGYFSIDKVHPREDQPREDFPDEEEDDEKDDVDQIQPIVVAPFWNEAEACVHFEIIDGQLRYERAKTKGNDDIFVVVNRWEPDREVLFEQALIANVARENLNPIEEARSFRRVLGEVFENDALDALTRKLKKRSRQYVKDRLRLLDLDEDIQQIVRKGKLSMAQANRMTTKELLHPRRQEVMARALGGISGDIAPAQVGKVIRQAKMITTDENPRPEAGAKALVRKKLAGISRASGTFEKGMVKILEMVEEGKLSEDQLERLIRLIKGHKELIGQFLGALGVDDENGAIESGGSAAVSTVPTSSKRVRPARRKQGALYADVSKESMSFSNLRTAKTTLVRWVNRLSEAPDLNELNQLHQLLIRAMGCGQEQRAKAKIQRISGIVKRAKTSLERDGYKPRSAQRIKEQILAEANS